MEFGAKCISTGLSQTTGTAAKLLYEYLQPSLSLFNYGNLKQKSDLFKRTRKSAAQITLRNLAAIWKEETNLPRASKTRPCKDDNLVFISKNEALASAEEEVDHFRKVLVSLVTFAVSELQDLHLYREGFVQQKLSKNDKWLLLRLWQRSRQTSGPVLALFCTQQLLNFLTTWLSDAVYVLYIF